MEKKYLSDCIRYTTDIAPYPFIQIYSGVGSGKNTFVDALAKGYEESQPDGRMETLEPKRVLCITSRRAKVDELKNAEDVAYGTQVLEYESLDYVEDLDSYLRRSVNCPVTVSGARYPFTSEASPARTQPSSDIWKSTTEPTKRKTFSGTGLISSS